MAVHSMSRKGSALCAAMAASMAGGCGSGFPDPFQRAAVADTSGEGHAGWDEGLANVSLPPVGPGGLLEVAESLPPVRIYRLGPASYLATNVPPESWQGVVLPPSLGRETVTQAPQPEATARAEHGSGGKRPVPPPDAR